MGVEAFVSAANSSWEFIALLLWRRLWKRVGEERTLIRATL